MKKKGMLYVFLCYLLSLNSGITMSGQQFVLLEMKTEFGISNATMATLSSVQLVTSIVMVLVLGQMMDRLDLKKLIVVGGSISLSGMLLNGFSTGPAMTAASFIVASIGSNITMAVPFPVFMRVDPDHATRHVNIQQGALSFGAFGWPLIMAVLVNNFHLNWRWQYRISASVLFFIVFMFAVLKPVKRVEKEPEEKKSGAGVTRLIFSPMFLALAATLGSYMFVEIGVLNYAKQYFDLGLNDLLGASLCISVIRAGMTITRFTGSRLIKNRVVLTFSGMTLGGIAALLMAVFRIPVYSLIWCLIFGLAVGPYWPTLFSMGLELNPQASGRLTNIMMLCNSLGMHIGNLCMGTVVDSYGPMNVFYFIAAACGACLVILFVAIRILRKKGHIPEGREWQLSHERFFPKHAAWIR